MTLPGPSRKGRGSSAQCLKYWHCSSAAVLLLLVCGVVRWQTWSLTEGSVVDARSASTPSLGRQAWGSYSDVLKEDDYSAPYGPTEPARSPSETARHTTTPSRPASQHGGDELLSSFLAPLAQGDASSVSSLFALPPPLEGADADLRRSRAPGHGDDSLHSPASISPFDKLQDIVNAHSLDPTAPGISPAQTQIVYRRAGDITAVVPPPTPTDITSEITVPGVTWDGPGVVPSGSSRNDLGHVVTPIPNPEHTDVKAIGEDPFPLSTMTSGEGGSPLHTRGETAGVSTNGEAGHLMGEARSVIEGTASAAPSGAAFDALEPLAHTLRAMEEEWPVGGNLWAVDTERGVVEVLASAHEPHMIGSTLPLRTSGKGAKLPPSENPLVVNPDGSPTGAHHTGAVRTLEQWDGWVVGAGKGLGLGPHWALDVRFKNEFVMTRESLTLHRMGAYCILASGPFLDIENDVAQFYLGVGLTTHNKSYADQVVVFDGHTPRHPVKFTHLRISTLPQRKWFRLTVIGRPKKQLFFINGAKMAEIEVRKMDRVFIIGNGGKRLKSPWGYFQNMTLTTTAPIHAQYEHERTSAAISAAKLDRLLAFDDPSVIPLDPSQPAPLGAEWRHVHPWLLPPSPSKGATGKKGSGSRGGARGLGQRGGHAQNALASDTLSGQGWVLRLPRSVVVVGNSRKLQQQAMVPAAYVDMLTGTEGDDDVSRYSPGELTIQPAVTGKRSSSSSSSDAIAWELVGVASRKDRGKGFPSGRLLTRGDAIDRHGAVFRFNGAPVGGRAAPLVGSRTTHDVLGDFLPICGCPEGRCCTRQQIRDHLAMFAGNATAGPATSSSMHGNNNGNNYKNNNSGAGGRGENGPVVVVYARLDAVIPALVQVTVPAPGVDDVGNNVQAPLMGSGTGPVTVQGQQRAGVGRGAVSAGGAEGRVPAGGRSTLTSALPERREGVREKPSTDGTRPPGTPSSATSGRQMGTGRGLLSSTHSLAYRGSASSRSSLSSRALLSVPTRGVISSGGGTNRGQAAPSARTPQGGAPLKAGTQPSRGVVMAHGSVGTNSAAGRQRGTTLTAGVAGASKSSASSGPATTKTSARTAGSTSKASSTGSRSGSTAGARAGAHFAGLLGTAVRGASSNTAAVAAPPASSVRLAPLPPSPLVRLRLPQNCTEEINAWLDAQEAALARRAREDSIRNKQGGDGGAGKPRGLLAAWSGKQGGGDQGKGGGGKWESPRSPLPYRLPPLTFLRSGFRLIMTLLMHGWRPTLTGYDLGEEAHSLYFRSSFKHDNRDKYLPETRVLRSLADVGLVRMLP
eukprot:jgi/Mesvir1/18712/Mv12423-RA.1